MRSALPYYVIGFIVLIALFLILGPRLTHGNRPGKVNEIVGSAEIKSAAGGNWRPLMLGEAVNPGDGLRTGKGAVLNLYWYGGSKIRLGEDSQAVLKHCYVNHVAKTVDLHVELMQGEIWARIPRPVSFINKVTLEAPETTFTAKHGALFSLALQPEAQTRLEVYSSRCDVAQGQMKVSVSGPKVAIFSQKGLAQGPRPMTETEIGIWRANTQITGSFVTVLAPQEGEKVSSSLLALSGYTDPGNTIQIEASNGGTVNATEAKVDKDGKWSAKLALTKGETRLRITAVDDEGRQSIVLRKVSY